MLSSTCALYPQQGRLVPSSSVCMYLRKHILLVALKTSNIIPFDFFAQMTPALAMCHSWSLASMFFQYFHLFKNMSLSSGTRCSKPIPYSPCSISLGSTTYPRSPASFYVRVCLQAKECGPGMFTAATVSLLAGCVSLESKEIQVCINPRTYTQLCLYLYKRRYTSASNPGPQGSFQPNISSSTRKNTKSHCLQHFYFIGQF